MRALGFKGFQERQKARLDPELIPKIDPEARPIDCSAPINVLLLLTNLLDQRQILEIPFLKKVQKRLEKINSPKD